MLYYITPMHWETSKLKKGSYNMRILWPLILTFTTILRFFVEPIYTSDNWELLHLKLDMEVCKSYISKQQIRAIALSTIGNRYLKDSWLHAFIDEFIFDDENGAWAVRERCVSGAYWELHSCYTPIRDHSTHYGCKIEVFYIALKQLSVGLSYLHRAVIFFDSLSALRSIADRQH